MSLKAQKRPYSTNYKKGVSTATVIRNWFKQCVHLLSINPILLNEITSCTYIKLNRTLKTNI